jgi:hypothetical protein
MRTVLLVPPGTYKYAHRKSNQLDDALDEIPNTKRDSQRWTSR